MKKDRPKQSSSKSEGLPVNPATTSPREIQEDFLLDDEDLPAALPRTQAPPSASAEQATADEPAEQATEQATEPSTPESPAASESEFEAPAEAEATPTPRRKLRVQEEKDKVHTHTGPLDRIGKIASLVLLPLLLVLVFWKILSNPPQSAERNFDRKPSTPIEGDIFVIDEVESGWRKRTEADRVSPMPQLITMKTVFADRLPLVKLKFANLKKDGYLRIFFLNGKGNIAGDPRTVRIVDGKLTATSKGEVVSGTDEVTVTASAGLENDHFLTDYFASNATRWSIELRESADGRAKGEDWKMLGHFAVADVALD